MSPENRDPAHLWDMLQEARTIVAFTRDVSTDQYLTDLKLRLAVEREIGVIGEAARRVSTSFRDAHPEIPWRGIVAQRNVLIHDYGEIDHPRIWRLAIHDVPSLVEHLTPLVPPPPEPTPES